MKNPSVYLAGPITGLTVGEASDWRNDVKWALSNIGIDAYSPLRGKQFALADKGALSAFGYDDQILTNSRAIMHRDYNDVKHCDALLVNLLGATQVSIGTVMEIAWAYAMQKIVVLVIESDKSNVHEHAMIREAISYRVPSVLMAVQVLESVLLPDLTVQVID